MYVFYATIVNAFIDIEKLKGIHKFNISYLKSNNHSIRIEINSSLTNHGNYSMNLEISCKIMLTIISIISSFNITLLFNFDIIFCLLKENPLINSKFL